MRIEGDTSVKFLIRNLKNGYRALSHLKLVSSSGFHLSVAGLLGVAGFLFAIKDGKLENFSSLKLLTDREDRPENLFFLPGLQNLGNNCFLNVILQALASCSEFRPFLQNAIEESKSSAGVEQEENLPLAFALASLLEELCVVGEPRVVRSPYKVMLAMTPYIGKFNLTSQQDAAEAFLHLLSSLREEFSDCYLPNQSTLADIFASPNSRIRTSVISEDQNEQERWEQHFLGPFNGILGSVLTCESCSSQVSLDFQFFHNLPIPLLHDSGYTLRFGITLEDCLKQFFTAEQVENYHCSRCWHIAAMKYLSMTGADEIGKLRRCAGEDSCDCQSKFHLENLPWSNNFSYTVKQLSIARCPKILCIHLQRASINLLGEPVKLQGHIPFPLSLNLSPFMTSGVGIKKWEERAQIGQVKQQDRKPSLHLNHFNMKFDAGMPNHIFRPMGENIHLEEMARDEFGCAKPAEAFVVEGLSATEGCLKTVNTDINMQYNKVNRICERGVSKIHLYRLVSVVEHFGRAGGGHYTVYRSGKAMAHKMESQDDSEASTLRWFCISDSDVSVVSENDVLAAEASLLFYERVIEG
ncbi:ubiquitin carboxyl-terminal hydrolase 27 isoform X2 [Carica papaya]|uniref:ubiquitin carboxyl-terminal hydrolase 27 isoform X2 n=1 Tax=Carica papaya TaxID=3649 RepID=UPI000B8CBC23|nr:ubiquitin carboxyl-terminal hydrolase 27 isoform X2 [Carica papaya]